MRINNIIIKTNAMRIYKLYRVLPFLLLTACGSADHTIHSGAAPDTTIVSEAPAAENKPQTTQPSTQKIIKTADFNCKVQNVFAVATKLEQVVQSLGGTVEESTIDNSGSATKTIYYKADTAKLIHTYTTTAQLRLLVPAQMIDSVINAIPGMVSFIYSRSIRQSNVSLHYIANEMKNQADSSNNATTILHAVKKTEETVVVNQYKNSRSDLNIDRKIENLDLLDKVSYATVTIALSQPEQVFVQTIASNTYIAHVPFIAAVKNELVNGWQIITEIFISLISIWPLLLIITVGIYKYKKLRSKRPVILND